MSTEIRSVVSTAARVVLDLRDGVVVAIGRKYADEPVEGDWGTNVTRADFLAAVAAECDAIVIPREELPRVKDRGQGTYEFDTGASLGTWEGKSAEQARLEARELLALAEYLDAHPPVDEAQVEALAAEIVQAQSPGYPDATDLARRLLATGRIEVRP